MINLPQIWKAFEDPEFPADRDAGKLDRDWIAACRQNEGGGVTLEGWICEAKNVQIAEIADDGSLWVGRMRGENHLEGFWLNQDQIDRVVKQIDQGL